MGLISGGVGGIFGARPSKWRPKWTLVLVMLVLLFSVLSMPRCQAQTWAEWFKQKKTQQKYLLNQIAALQVYLGYARDGYKILGSGIQTVRDITNGEFNLHSAFVSGLRLVNPVVSGDSRVAEILSMQVSVLGTFAALRRDSGLFGLDLDYVSLVSGAVIGECLDDLSELLLVMTSGKLDMGDAERLSRISGIHARISDKYGFCRSFYAEVSGLAGARQQVRFDVELLRRYYGKE